MKLGKKAGIIIAAILGVVATTVVAGQKLETPVKVVECKAENENTEVATLGEQQGRLDETTAMPAISITIGQTIGNYKYVQFKDINEYKKHMHTAEKHMIFDLEEKYVTSDGAEIASGTTNGVTEDSASAESESTTNLQVQGVDEADILKNDGRYLYYTSNNEKIIIVDTKNELKVVATINKPDYISSFNDMYLDGDNLIVIGQGWCGGGTDAYPVVGEEDTEEDRLELDNNRNFGIVQVYNIKDKANPVASRTIQLSGNFKMTRKIDDKLYIMTSEYNYNYNKKNDLNEVLPFYLDSNESSNTKYLDINNIYKQDWSEGKSTNLLAVIDLTGKSSVKPVAIIGDRIENEYMSKDGFYIVSEHTNKAGNDETVIGKFDIVNSGLNYVASNAVEGSTLNQFSMDEYKGVLRVATTTYRWNIYNQTNTSESTVWTLDKDLNRIGKITGLGKGERIYSVRFEGDKGYVVTFKETDPLYALDLSNPKNPKKLGEVKIPGFSSYLHPIGDNLVVGIGNDVDVLKNGGVVTEGIKLSLFDVSNPAMPKEINNIILGVSGTYSEALNNHKAVTVNKEKQMLAIPIHIEYGENSSNKPFEGAYVVAVENGKLVGKTKLGALKQDVYEMDYYNSCGQGSRVCYIGDNLYFIYGNAINKYDIKTYSRKQTVFF